MTRYCDITWRDAAGSQDLVHSDTMYKMVILPMISKLSFIKANRHVHVRNLRIARMFGSQLGNRSFIAIPTQVFARVRLGA